LPPLLGAAARRGRARGGAFGWRPIGRLPVALPDGGPSRLRGGRGGIRPFAVAPFLVASVSCLRGPRAQPVPV